MTRSRKHAAAGQGCACGRTTDEGCAKKRDARRSAQRNTDRGEQRINTQRSPTPGAARLVTAASAARIFDVLTTKEAACRALVEEWRTRKQTVGPLSGTAKPYAPSYYLGLRDAADALDAVLRGEEPYPLPVARSEVRFLCRSCSATNDTGWCTRCSAWSSPVDK